MGTLLLPIYGEVARSAGGATSNNLDIPIRFFCIVPVMRRQLGWLGILPALAALTPYETVSAAAPTFMPAMQAASQARQVPLPLIEAITYVNSRWEWIGTPASDGGVGPMHVTPKQMAQAAGLSGHSQAQIESDLSANLDAGAALLANAHTGANDLASWHPAVVATQGPVVATQIYDALRSGESRTTNSGEQIVLAAQALPSSSLAPNAPIGGASVVADTPDYSGATWNPANVNNYSYANRPHDYPVQLIVIHDIEGTYGSAIQHFQDPNAEASAHYVVSDAGQITQMVHEHDIAWHAGNWDYNTRAIGIEHEGFAYAQPTWYTTVMYQASAHLIASICSRWGVPMDRTHVIGHAEVPDPNNPGLYGGAEHHTDPGPYWDWTYYMGQAQAYANALPSPPRMMPDPVAVSGFTSASITWKPAQTCHTPITGYTVTSQPATTTMNLPASATSATFNNLQQGTSYTFTVTAIDADGQDSLTTNAIVPGHCGTAQLTSSPASPRPYGTTVQFTATSTGCPNPLYQFWVQLPGQTAWNLGQDYSSSATFSWSASAQVFGRHYFMALARDASSAGDHTDYLGTYDTFTTTTFTVTPATCTSVTESGAPISPQASGTQVTFTATASGCPNPRYEFWARWQGYSTWQLLQGYSTSNTYTWNSTGAAPGTEYIGVWVKDSSSANTLDASTSIPYSVTTPKCASVTVSAAPASVTHGSGTHVTITGAASSCTSPNPRYEFWMRAASMSTWQLVQGYSTGTTYDWNSTGAAAGTVYFGVWVKDSGSPSSLDANASTPVTVN